jgi:hypothetical protein
MYIEDIIDNLVGFSSLGNSAPRFLGAYDEALLSSFDSQLSSGLGLTEKQQTLAVRILKKHSQEISNLLSKPVELFLENPQFRSPPRSISHSKTVKLFKDQENKRSLIRVSFPYDEKLVNDIKTYKREANKNRMSFSRPSSSEDIFWNTQSRTWDFHLREEHIDWLNSKLSSEEFLFDKELKEFANEIEKVKIQIENYVPMVIFDGKNFKFSNTHKNIPQPQSNDLLEVLFFAKKYGIDTWDENIDQSLNDGTINPYTKALLSKKIGSEIVIDPEIVVIDDLADTVNYIGNTVFVIPGGDEYNMLTKSHQFLQRMGIKNEQISVLFRLDGNTGKICNDYVKDNQLNNPIDEKINIFFISTKVPKPLLKTSTTIDAIVNLGSTTVHYTLKNLLKNHHFVINYTTKKLKERYIF